MEEQIVSAIQIAWDPAANQSLKPQAFQYVNQLRQEAAAWRPCLTIFTHLPRHPDVVRVFCLEIVNNAIQAGIIDANGLRLVKDELMTYLQNEYSPADGKSETPDSASIENKIAQTITYLFCSLYENGWETCIDDLLSLTTTSTGAKDNLLGVAFYLRVINSIHDEIGDQLVSRSRPEQDRANTLKDLIRMRDVQKIARSWQEILSYWRVSNGTVAELSMKAIGKWVSWIDISLVVNQEMLPHLFQQLEQASASDLEWEEEKARDAAVDVFAEIVAKKMPASDKINMIAFIDLQNVVDKLVQCPILANSKTSIYDVDLAENVAKLVNVTMVDIVRALENEQQSSETWRKAEQMLRGFLPHLLRYFADEWDDVCSHVLQAMTDLLTFIRRAFRGPESTSQRTAMLMPILTAIFLKSRIDEAADIEGDYEGDNTEEAEFIELRKRLSSLQQSIAQADEQLYIDAVSGLVNATFEKLQTQGGQLNWRDLDLALFEMSLLGDYAIKSGGLYIKNKPDSPAAERLVRMMILMMESNTGSYANPGIQVQYMELCVRYSPFFDKNVQYLNPTLQNFIQHCHSRNPRLKQRAWYLLQRLVRQQRQNVGPSAEFIIPKLQDLLTIKAELPKEDDEDESSNNEEGHDSTFSSQLYLFEAIGCLMSTSSISADKQVQLAEAVMHPVFNDIQNNIEAAKSDKLANLQVHHDIEALGSVAKGYSDWSGSSVSGLGPHAPEPVKQAFARVSEATLVALESLKSSLEIREAARYTFSRMIGLAERQMLQQLPRWVDGLLTESASRDEMAQMLRTLDQITFGFKTEIFSFLDTIFGSLLQRIFAGISTTASGTDDEIELAELKREYINFLLVILGNDLSDVLVSTTNQPHFESMIGTIEHFTKDPQDPMTAKMAFQLLTRMCMVWGGADVVPGQTIPDANTSTSEALPGFKQFMISRLSPLCWALPSNSAFNVKDAQARQVLTEAGALQKTIYAKTGQEYLTYLKDSELPGLGLQGAMLNEYLTKLTTLDPKAWKSWFAKFVSSGGAA